MNNFVYDFSGKYEFEEILNNPISKEEYNINVKEYEKSSENVKYKLKKEVLGSHFNNFLNCYSGKNEWLLVKYMKRKIIEFNTSLKTKNKKNFPYEIDSEEFCIEIENKKKKINNSKEEITKIKEKAN